ncbi:hypothetical protein [Lactobacillus johnsonii]|uniref:Uncharacterized protein n=1 Tax=Lactobacillus johnsonii TaxID=33959 RepID=A0A9X6RVH9_LACJH|nr:hypothetical protein [Lactobacillus johnsonii]OYS05032.1 hypothetical protein CBF54_03225 [Lactobacillus johnsonii]OYS08019.1 hypothetical protein CBF63_06265 [Lactobacillus johnsonii]OYS08588.1 hypothetical protein CBF62_02465 [Lactobacillus johnsonii]OYS09779.1 hypothetical protein CBF65_03230 [Lactobacillus johnsonii]OYS11669.1 hypothetical protein CBF50_08195 [Lactobacillus johnsonii]
MNNKLNLFNIGLPTSEDLNTWSKDCIKQRLDHNISGNLIPFVSEAPDYELNENMVALYDFHTNPIKGRYQSVIFDKKAGIILCQKNSRQLINHLLKHKLILGAVLQKKLQKELGFYYRHTISLGEIAYFSLRAHSEKHTSWIGLHHMQTVQQENGPVTFSYQENGYSYNFEFEDCAPNMYKRLGEAITHNHVLGQMLVGYAKSHGFHLNLCKCRKNSLVANQEYFYLTKIQNALNLTELAEEAIEEFHRNYGRHCADFFDIKDWQINDHNLIYRLSRRIKSIL